MSARSRDTQIPVGPLVAAVGAILLIVSLFLDWYEELAGFTVFEFIDLLLVALALVTLVALAGAMGLVRSPIRPGVPLAVAVLALLIVLSQIVNDPPAVAGPNGADQDTGIWLAFAGAALMVAGAVLSTARIAIAVEPRSRAAGTPEPAPARQQPARPAPPADDAPTIRDEPPPRP
jgi:hypothetical protein